jgi:hypothetical protein
MALKVRRLTEEKLDSLTVLDEVQKVVALKSFQYYWQVEKEFRLYSKEYVEMNGFEIVEEETK